MILITSSSSSSSSSYYDYYYCDDADADDDDDDEGDDDDDDDDDDAYPAWRWHDTWGRGCWCPSPPHPHPPAPGSAPGPGRRGAWRRTPADTGGRRCGRTAVAPAPRTVPDRWSRSAPPSRSGRRPCYVTSRHLCTPTTLRQRWLSD